MRVIELITEMNETFYDSFKNHVTGEHVEVWENPSRAEFLKLVNTSRANLLRAWLYDHSLIVWDAYLSTHNVGVNLPDTDSKIIASLILSKDHVIINHYNYFGNTPEEAMAFAKANLQHHPLLIRIFGNNVKIKIEDFEQFDSTMPDEDIIKAISDRT